MDGNALGVGYIGCMCKELVDHVGWDWFSYIASFVFVFFFLIVGYLIWFFFIFFVLITDYFWYYRICNTIDGIKRETKRREREERKRRSHIQL